MYSKLTIVWIPGHEGLVGNENVDADALARKGPETFCNLKERLKIWETKV